ncbi:MAG: hypothetical protein D6805_10025 [Planctomycetota bacterium]|nr:MAG: hypothetical protein D6805_10025 [Planctomycetota bacterium]
MEKFLKKVFQTFPKLFFLKPFLGKKGFCFPNTSVLYNPLPKNKSLALKKLRTVPKNKKPRKVRKTPYRFS